MLPRVWIVVSLLLPLSNSPPSCGRIETYVSHLCSGIGFDLGVRLQEALGWFASGERKSEVVLWSYWRREERQNKIEAQPLRLYRRKVGPEVQIDKLRPPEFKLHTNLSKALAPSARFSLGHLRIRISS